MYELMKSLSPGHKFITRFATVAISIRPRYPNHCNTFKMICKLVESKPGKPLFALPASVHLIITLSIEIPLPFT